MTSDFDTIYDRTGTESSKWHSHDPDVLPMYVADMDFRSPEPIIAALRERVEHGFFGYGKERPEFFEVVCERLRRRYGWDVAPEAIVTTPGVIPAFSVAVKAFANGGSVLMHTPAYGPILHCPEHQGLERDEAPLRRTEDGRYEHDAEAFAAAIRPSTRVFINCNPHNPAGRVFQRGELEQMAGACLANDIVIASDEIHCDLVYPGHEHVPIATLSPEVEARTITFMAPSKTFNLPGLKTAIAVIPNEELRTRFEAARGDFVKAVNILGYTAALAAYRDCDDWLQEAIAYLDGNRRFVGEYIAQNMPAIGYVPPEGTYLAWLNCRRLGLDNPHDFFLAKGRVALSDGANFGPGGEGFVRLNFACPRKMLTDGLERMCRALETLGAK